MASAAVNVRELVRAARASGVAIALDGDDLVLDAQNPPSPALIDGLRRHKQAIVILLAADAHLGTGGLDTVAFERCIAAWLDRNPEVSAPDACAWCKRTPAAGSVVVPFGTEVRGHAWLHPGCWHDWHQSRRKKAVRALAALGITACVDPGAMNFPSDFDEIGAA